MSSSDECTRAMLVLDAERNRPDRRAEYLRTGLDHYDRAANILGMTATQVMDLERRCRPYLFESPLGD